MFLLHSRTATLTYFDVETVRALLVVNDRTGLGPLERIAHSHVGRYRCHASHQAAALRHHCAVRGCTLVAFALTEIMMCGCLARLYMQYGGVVGQQHMGAPAQQQQQHMQARQDPEGGYYAMQLVSCVMQCTSCDVLWRGERMCICQGLIERIARWRCALLQAQQQAAQLVQQQQSQLGYGMQHQVSQQLGVAAAKRFPHSYRSCISRNSIGVCTASLHSVLASWQRADGRHAPLVPRCFNASAALSCVQMQHSPPSHLSGGGSSDYAASQQQQLVMQQPQQQPQQQEQQTAPSTQSQLPTRVENQSYNEHFPALG
jgi:hypothetical protein